MAGFTPIFEPDVLDEFAGIDRLRPSDGIMLTADHLLTEQLYNRGRMARMLQYLHGAGTVAGLDVVYVDNPAGQTELQVSPGLAIDYRGRLLELSHLSCLKVQDWFASLAESSAGQSRLTLARRAAGSGLPEHIVVDLFAEFRAYAKRPEPAFASGNADHIDAITPTLCQDSIYLNMVMRDGAYSSVAQSMISRIASDPIDITKIQEAKRKALWPALGPRPDQLAPDPTLPPTEHVRGTQAFGGVFLARLRLPIRPDPADAARLAFDNGVSLTNPALQPDVTGRLYSYSAAELALLAGHRR